MRTHPEQRNDVGQSPLAPAIHAGHREIVEKLLTVAAPTGAARECVSTCRPGAFAIAVLAGQLEIAERLHRTHGGAAAQRLPSGRWLLDAVAERGNAASTDYLLRHGALRDERNGGVAALFTAIAGFSGLPPSSTRQISPSSTAIWT